MNCLDCGKEINDRALFCAGDWIVRNNDTLAELTGTWIIGSHEQYSIKPEFLRSIADALKGS